jgi:enoyl-[acyl-carrier protein] reductase III
VSTALVVGGTGGAGEAIVRRLAAEGWDVVFTYFRAAAAAAATERDCSAAPGRCEAVKLDLRRTEAIGRIVARIGDDLGCVVFAAASGVWRPLDEVTDKQWDWTFNINARGLLHLHQAVLPALARSGGSLVVVTSLGGSRVIPEYGILGMAKAATDAFVRYAAAEAGRSGVRVNAIAPGLMRTKALRLLPGVDAHLERVAHETPLGRLVTPDDVADVAVWLLSPAAAMVTGQMIVVDGGRDLLADPAVARLAMPSGDAI